MRDFQSFFLMSTEDVKRYAVEILHSFQPDEPLQCAEIGDGNINYVFRVWSERDGRSIVVKQADRLLRSSGRPLDPYHNKIEAEILRLEWELAPDYVPKVLYYDETMSAVSMEDISAYKNLRKELQANRVYGHLAGNLSSFMADTLLPTTDLILDPKEKKRRVQFFTNPELCQITEELVLTEPFNDFKHRNVFAPDNEAFVREYLYENERLHAEVGKLRCAFMNNAQALIHGDLHSGSIFANEQGVKIIDPEFAFYGPMGYDIGNVIGNLFFSWANKHFTMPEAQEAISALEKAIVDVYDLTRAKLEKKYDELVEYPFYRTAAFKKSYLDSVMEDSVGYAGTEIIRRTVGESKVMEIDSVTDPVQRTALERVLILLGIRLIEDRAGLTDGASVAQAFHRILDV